MGKYEEPRYQIIHQDKHFEIRTYEPYVTVTTSDSTLAGSGFNRLFGFISGQNQAAQKMAMTIPVINDVASQTMEFVLPLEMDTIDKAPLPTSNQLKLKQYPKETVAVVYFSGRATPDVIEKQLGFLTQEAAKKGYMLSKNYRLARYNSPFSFPFLRRNEILCSVEDNA